MLALSLRNREGTGKNLWSFAALVRHSKRPASAVQGRRNSESEPGANPSGLAHHYQTGVALAAKQRALGTGRSRAALDSRVR